MSNLLYDRNTTIGRLFYHFQTYFTVVSTPTAHTLILFLIFMIAFESADSVRFIYTHFMSRIFGKSLNTLYYAFSYAKVDHMAFLSINVRLALGCIHLHRRYNG